MRRHTDRLTLELRLKLNPNQISARIFVPIVPNSARNIHAKRKICADQESNRSREDVKWVIYSIQQLTNHRNHPSKEGLNELKRGLQDLQKKLKEPIECLNLPQRLFLAIDPPHDVVESGVETPHDVVKSTPHDVVSTPHDVVVPNPSCKSQVQALQL